MVLGKRKRVIRRGRASKTVSKLAAQVKKNTSLLKNTVEGKQIYKSGVDPQGLNSFEYYTVMDGLAQGVADTGTGATVSTGARIGNSINIKSITMRMMLNGQHYTVDPLNPQGKCTGVYRLLIYNSPCGETLSKDDILRDASTSTQALKSHYNIDVAKGKMYEIWYDKIICIDDAHTCKDINFVKKWKHGKQVIYDNNTTSPSNFQPRVLLLGVNNVNTDDFHYSFKVRYEDL